jgi:hypothetical protein
MHTTTKQEVGFDTGSGLDGVTVGSIGILAYMLANVLHEGAGHGGACSRPTRTEKACRRVERILLATMA